jgi:acyl transferase domain-containing protein/NAD(P)-dependent dehydrogenase (short-subunit alcohol dehydrogenase family)/acyl carrier protein
MKPNPYQSTPVAIIGIGCIFAKSTDLKAFFHLLIRGINGISNPPPTHKHLMDYFDADPKKPDHIYCNRGGFLPKIDFDPTEFNIPPNVLEATDTSQLLGLLTAKRALDDAGYGDGGRPFDRSRTGVILGVTGTQELVIPLGARLGHPLWKKALDESGVPADQAAEVIQRIGDGYVGWQENSFPGLLGNVVAGRIANRLDLGGTNCVVDAACASSMGAIHMALLELASGRSEMVITGGVDTINDAFMHMCFSKTQILSATGDIRPFSREADGTVLGEGVGLVVLKRLDDAERDGDRIYAVIKGLGSSSDGRSSSIYAPRTEGQTRALRRAYQDAGVDPTRIGMVEAHGTGTRVGDQVEFQALCEVFGQVSPNGNRCALGSVKSNIGHTKAAAGTAGLIKAALSVYHKVLLPTLKAESVDPKLGVEHSPFYINTRLRPWISSCGDKRRAGVSAFGFGGSNFHAVLEEYAPEKQDVSWDGSTEIAAFSGANVEEIAALAEQWQRQAVNADPLTIGKLARQSRNAFRYSDAHRMLLVLDLYDGTEGLARIFDQALSALRGSNAPAGDSVFLGSGPCTGKLAFLFPGQGSQYVGMGRDVICCFPESFQVFQEAAIFMSREAALEDAVFPRSPGDAGQHEARLRRTQIAQPAIGAVSAAMLKALEHFGVSPDATCGHSFGELVALYAAGWMPLQDLWRLAAERGRLMAAAGKQSGDTGAMLAVKAPLSEVQELVQELEGAVVLANRNSPDQGVLSGPLPAIETAGQACKAKGWVSIRLPVAAGFHCGLVAGAQEPFQELVREVAWTPGDVPVMSNTLGGAYPREKEAVQTTLAQQLARPVDFLSNIQTLYEQGVRTFVEVGPRTVLTDLVRSILNGSDVHTLPMDRSRGKASGIVDMARVLAELAALGYNVDLRCWEKPISRRREARMTVSLSGANYRVTKAGPDPAAHRPKPGTAQPQRPPEKKDSGPLQPQTLQKTTLTINSNLEMDPSNKSSMESALAALQKGMAALQALQSQTAQAHQKFLETQAEASRTLQMMLQSTQQLAVPATPDRSIATPPASIPDGFTSATPEMPFKNGIAPSSFQTLSPHIREDSVLSHPEPAPGIGSTGGLKSAGGVDDEDPIGKNLLSVVSRLTGYPAEMLGLDMDIEADLGIDSIKRVEILSALEEQMPDLPRVTPDMMGSLKTLGQICSFLTSGTGAAAAPGESPGPGSIAEPAQAAAPAEDVRPALIDIVSRLTGYPAEMLGLDMDIEADLGIDSIKRVEILSALEEQMPDLPRVTPDMMGSLKTLGQIIAYLSASGQEPLEKPQAETSMNVSGGSLQQCPEQSEAAGIRRQIIRVKPHDRVKGPAWSLPEGRFIGVSGGPDSLRAALITALKDRGLWAKHLNEPEGLVCDTALAGMVLLAPMEAQEAFLWAKACARSLDSTAGDIHGCFITVSSLDGAFGFNGGAIDEPLQGALAGLTKTASLEWPRVRCLALDLDPDWQDIPAVARALADEVAMAHNHQEIEIGLAADRRVCLHLEPDSFPEDAKIRLNAEDVVIVTGGARGVTAACAKSLAAHTPCTLVLLGRTSPPQPEPSWLADLSEAGPMKKAIMVHDFSGRTPSPLEVEKRYRFWCANREIQATLDTLKNLGIAARYFSVDVNDASAVKDVVRQAGPEPGRIRALIHGAGVLEDRLIADKHLEQFKRVFNTKVNGLLNILDALDGATLEYLVLFSSVSARIGNRGQADYAMANEVLNKIARQQARQHPQCKVSSINWGPWDGGMVTASLKRTFLKNNINLIPQDQGAGAMLMEMAGGPGEAIEVVIGGLLSTEVVKDRQRELSTLSAAKPVALSLTCKREVTVSRHPVLQSHILDGRPVVPLALIAEWLAHSALHANPGLTLHGMDDLRLLNGITLDDPAQTIQLLAGKARRRGSFYEVDVEIRNEQSDEPVRIHASAKAVLTDRLPKAGLYEGNGFRKTDGGALPSPRDLYRHVLFHGKDLRGLREIFHISDSGIAAGLKAAPPPSQWMQHPLRSRWIADPLVMDGAFQMAIVWCHEQLGRVSLPSFAASYRQYCSRFPQDGVVAVMKVRKCNEYKLQGDFTFLDHSDRVVASLNGYEAIMAPDLFKAFKAA